MLQLSMKCWNSTFNAQGSRLIVVLIVVLVHLKTMKNENICNNYGGVQGRKKKGSNSVYHQNRWFFEFHPLLNANVFFFRFKKNNSPYVWPNSGFWCFVFLTLWIILMLIKCWTSHFISNCKKFVTMSHIL
jgi:hypothetical protein